MTESLTDRDILSDPVYSNYDHELHHDLVDQLRSDPDKWGMHTAFDYCGMIRYNQDAGYSWTEEVWRHGKIVYTASGDDLAALIKNIVAIHGDK